MSHVDGIYSAYNIYIYVNLLWVATHVSFIATMWMSHDQNMGLMGGNHSHGNPGAGTLPMDDHLPMGKMTALMVAHMTDL